MWPYIFGAVGSGPFWLVVGGWLGARVIARLDARLAARVTLLETIRDLENRRVAVESGRDTLVRRGAGAPARVSDGMASKPGVYAQYLRDSTLTKKNEPESG